MILSLWDKLLLKIVKHSTKSIEICLPIEYPVDAKISKILHRRGYTETLQGWQKGFVLVLVKKEGVFIRHNIGGKFDIKLTKIENPLVAMESFLDYFEKI